MDYRALNESFLYFLCRLSPRAAHALTNGPLLVSRPVIRAACCNSSSKQTRDGHEYIPCDWRNMATGTVLGKLESAFTKLRRPWTMAETL